MILSCQDAVENRRSIRKFESRAVSREDLDQIIEAARLAPSETNRQPWRFVLLTSQEEKDKIAGAVLQPFVLAAPAVFVCCLDRQAYLRSHVEKRMGELVRAKAISDDSAGYINQLQLPEQLEDVVLPSSAYIDLGIAVENMVLMATALGLGSCWVRLFSPRQVHENLALPPEIKVVALLPIGYPAQSALPRPRLSRNEIMIEA
jgi:nitroreductase